MLQTEYSGFGVNTMSADALAPNVARVSSVMVFTVQDSQQVLLFQNQFHLLGSSQIRNMN